MTPKGKKKLIESLSKVIEQWCNEVDPNAHESTYIGYVGDRVYELMAEVAITALELSADAQKYLMRDGMMTE